MQLGVAGGLALIWASLGVFGAVTSAVNDAWGVEKQRSFLRHRMVSFLMLVAGGGVMILGLLLVGAVQVAQASWFGVMLDAVQVARGAADADLHVLGHDPADPRRSASSTTSFRTPRPGFATSGSAPC